MPFAKQHHQPQQQLRNKDAHAYSTSSVSTSVSSDSLSSSLSSSAALSDLLPAAPSNSSQSDIPTDHSLSSLSPPSKNRFFPLSLSSAPLRSAPETKANMGQSYSRPVAPAISPSQSSSSTTGGRIKRVWAGRRKKSEDISAFFSGALKGKDRDPSDASSVTPPTSTSDRSHSHSIPPGPDESKLTLQTASNIFGAKTSSQTPKSPKFSGSAPPPPPPKPAVQAWISSESLPPMTPAKDAQQSAPVAASRPSVSPPPIRLVRNGDGESEKATFSLRERVVPSQDKEKMKEDWRKSDSTMASHSTIRPGALSGNRSPRPVSLAESSHSGNTIVPVNKRLSALITDAEFTMFEEESDGADVDQGIIARVTSSGGPSPSGSVKARNRRSPPATYSPGRFFSDSGPTSPLASARDIPTLTRAAATGIISPTNAGGTTQNTGHNIRGRLAAWTAVSASSSPVSRNRPLPPPPSITQSRRPATSSGSSAAQLSSRQTAVSMSGSLAPAAGLASFGKRAVEKVVGRAWAGSARVHQSGPIPMPSSGGWKSRRRGHHGFSGASSVHSSLTSSSSECDQFVTVGPNLGMRLRGPRLNSLGVPIAGGLVFKRDLQTCVRETAIDDVLRQMAFEAQDYVMTNGGVKPLEARLLPALALRCAQHILKWGVQEEGLFRVSGRSSHVAKLRSEFDAGADYDMADCDPSDLDPHAVASIFKTYLRELPENILTTTLIPYFESALSAEDDMNIGTDSAIHLAPGNKGPSIPRNNSSMALRKPPSLSTLAMPSFAGVRSVSDSLLSALACLVARLPRENRDILYTVVELIKATVAHSKETKMPLGNLLLVFCPSLNMSPSLLRVLCEADSIWEGVPKDSIDPTVLDIKDESQVEVIDVQASGSPAESSAEKCPDRTQPPGERISAASEDPDTDGDDDALYTLASTTLSFDDDPMADSSKNRKFESVLPPFVPIDPITPVSPLDDSASFVSALEPPSVVPTRSPSPVSDDPQVPPLTSSSDSLDYPSSMSEELASPQVSSCDELGSNKPGLASQDSFTIPETVDLSLPATPRRTAMNVPFPSSGSAPHTPVSQRKSFALLSLPPLRSESSPSATTDPYGRPKRVKRPSLHLLFSRKSTASLCSAAAAAPISAAASVPAFTQQSSTPVFWQAPQMSVTSLPPKLDTSISSSPILALDEMSSQLKGKLDTLTSSGTALRLSSSTPVWRQDCSHHQYRGRHRRDRSCR
ncbi:hypothetical protein A0H81_11921 [Grifola frondosa]|uniref:Rho-GAP domain-containing protein n=1 Tax=Grifola frondosa TaxID=5627 RepID=A0A1C7LTI6_GRIFR|nr:hypothetical protein A0H81_11921 [Grifola frondosa]